MNIFRRNKDYKTDLNATTGSKVTQRLLPFAVAIKGQLGTANDAYSRYRLCDDVRSVVDSIADGMMMVDLHVVDANDKPLPNHPLQILLNFVNNSQPAKDFYREVYLDFLLCGETFLLKKKNGNTTVELEHIPARRMSIEIEGENLVYVVTNAMGQVTNYPEASDEIIHIHTALLDQIRSASPLESVASLIDASISSDMIASSMAKSGIYKTFFKIGYDTDTQAEIVKQIIADISSIENAGGVLPVPIDVPIEIMEAKNGLESAFNETIDKLISSALAKLYHVPTDYLTSTYTQGKYQQAEINVTKFYEGAVLPQIELLVSFLNFSLVNREYKGVKVITSTNRIPALSPFNTDNIADFDTLANRIGSRKAYQLVFNQEPETDVVFKDEESTNG